MQRPHGAITLDLVERKIAGSRYFTNSPIKFYSNEYIFLKVKLSDPDGISLYKVSFHFYRLIQGSLGGGR